MPFRRLCSLRPQLKQSDQTCATAIRLTVWARGGPVTPPATIPSVDQQCIFADELRQRVLE